MPLRPRLTPFALALSAGLPMLAASVGEVQAQAMDIDGPEITARETELKSVNTINGRYPRGTTGVPRSSHELGVAYAPTDWVKLNLVLGIENLVDTGWQADSIIFKTQFSLLKAPESGGLALGWATAVSAGLPDDATNSVVFGPILKVSSGKASVTVNPYLEKTFGRNHDDGIAFTYGWQGKLEVREGFSVGIEGFGTVDNIGDAPPLKDQDHRIGPVLYFAWDAGQGRAVQFDIGVLAGVTDAAPDVSVKANIGTTF